MGRRRGRAVSRGGWRGCCTPVSARSPSASSSTSSALATRDSKRQPFGWWALHSSSLGWRVVCCELPSVYSPSLAADGGPTIRRAEDCLDAEKARRCLWRGARGLAPRSARQQDAWTHHPATFPAYPAGKKTNVYGGTEPPPPPLQSLTWLYPRNLPPRLLPKDHHRETSPSQELRLRVNSYSAPLSYAPNQAINPSWVLSDSNVDS